MNEIIPRRIAIAAGILILLSGITNLVLGIQIGALLYYPYPGGKMGHVGITAGLAAIGIGLGMIYLLPKLYNHPQKRWRITGAVLTFISGHAGAVFGALYVGTASLIWQASGC